MGFGGGAMVGAPLAAMLMNHFASPEGLGVWQSFVVMAVIYFVFMIGRRCPIVCRRPAGNRQAGTPAAKANNAMITKGHVHAADTAWKTPQFWLVSAVLCLNVSAGIGIIGMASPLLQEVFAGKLIGVDLAFNELSAAQLAEIAAITASFTGILGLSQYRWPLLLGLVLRTSSGTRAPTSSLSGWASRSTLRCRSWVTWATWRCSC